jgi:hypothetical protein
MSTRAARDPTLPVGGVTTIFTEPEYQRVPTLLVGLLPRTDHLTVFARPVAAKSHRVNPAVVEPAMIPGWLALVLLPRRDREVRWR